MSLKPGTLIGRYEILGLIDSGGMGEVYRARDPDLDRMVAIKILSKDLASDVNALNRFEREARAVAALSHPNILAIHDIGRQDEIVYLVTELLEGETLRSQIRRSSIPWAKAAAIGSAVAEGVAAAHAKNIIHRDLKPENIFLTSNGQIKILDFGLASVKTSPSIGAPADTATVTHAGTILGTVGYMSPEQVKAEIAQSSSDMFSLGCVLWEMVTGKQAFAGKTPIQTLNAILETEPPTLADCNKRVPLEFDRLISRCLEKDPALRMQSARDLSVSLTELVSHKPSVSNGSQSPGWGLLFAGVLATIASVAIIAIIVTNWSSDQSVQPVDPKQINSLAVLPLDNSSGDSSLDYFAEGVTDTLIADLGRRGDLKVIAHAAVTEYKDSALDLAAIAEQLNVQAIVTGSVIRSNDRVQVMIKLIDPVSEQALWSNSFESQLKDVLQLQAEIVDALVSTINARKNDQSRSIASRANSNRISAVDTKAYESYLKAIYLLGTATTDEVSQETIELLNESVNREPGFAQAHAALATAYIHRRSHIVPQEARTLDSNAFAAVRRALLIDPDLAEAYMARGELLWTPSHRFPHERAVREYRLALEKNSNLDGAHEGLARVYSHVGLFDEALFHAERALELNPSNGLALHHKSEALLWTDRNQEALTVLNSIPRSVHPELVAAHKAWALSRIGKQEQAWDIIRHAIVDFPQDPNGVLAAISAVFLAETDIENTTARIKRATTKSGFNPSHHTQYFVACAFAKLRQPGEAVLYLEQAAENGFPCYPLRMRDTNLDFVRDNPTFRAFLKEEKKKFEATTAALQQSSEN